MSKVIINGKKYICGSNNDMKGATLDNAGTSGLVPAPNKGDQDKFLKGDGTWQNVDDHTATFTSNDSSDNSVTSWTSVTKLSSGESIKSILNKISTMFKNIRYLYRDMNLNTLRIINYGEDFTSWNYTANKRCEVCMSFKIPLGPSFGKIVINGTEVFVLGFPWNPGNTTQAFMVPFSFTLQKNDIVDFVNQEGDQLVKISAYLISIRY